MAHRRDAHKRVRFDTFVTPSEDGTFLSVQPRGFAGHDLPAMDARLPHGQTFTEHPLLRVFDGFLSRRFEDPGRVGSIHHLLHELPTGEPRHLFSIAETRGNVSIFPAFGMSSWKRLKGSQTGQNDCVHHLTFNKSDKEVRTHLSEPPSSSPKRFFMGNWPTVHGPRGERWVARFSIYKPHDLDPLSEAHLFIPHDCIPSGDVANAARAFQTSLAEPSMIKCWPSEWRLAGHHLEVLLGLAGEDWSTADRAPQLSAAPVAHPVEQVVRLPLQGEFSLVALIRLDPGRADRSFGFAPALRGWSPDGVDS